jgi:hypothetical protein
MFINFSTPVNFLAVYLRTFLEAFDRDAHCGISDAAAGFAQFG